MPQSVPQVELPKKTEYFWLVLKVTDLEFDTALRSFGENELTVSGHATVEMESPLPGHTKPCDTMWVTMEASPAKHIEGALPNEWRVEICVDKDDTAILDVYMPRDYLRSLYHRVFQGHIKRLRILCPVPKNGQEINGARQIGDNKNAERVIFLTNSVSVFFTETLLCDGLGDARPGIVDQRSTLNKLLEDIRYNTRYIKYITAAIILEAIVYFLHLR
jgi:hypothetical protein